MQQIRVGLVSGKKRGVLRFNNMSDPPEARLLGLAASVRNVAFFLTGALYFFLVLLALLILSIFDFESIPLLDYILLLEWVAFTFVSFFFAFRPPQFKSTTVALIFFTSYSVIAVAGLALYFGQGSCVDADGFYNESMYGNLSEYERLNFCLPEVQ
jgi:hypothetical protein